MKGTLLYILSIVLLVIIYPFGYIWSLILSFQIKKEGRYNEDMALSVDALGNVFLAPVLNKYAILNYGYKFGYRVETISSVLGKNLERNTLTKFGKWISNVLDTIDKKHCIKSIDLKRNW